MDVGFNYPYSYNRGGGDIGPNIWVDPKTWEANNRLEAAGSVAQIPLPPLFDHVDRNLRILKNMGVTVVRWFLLANGNQYGPAPTKTYPVAEEFVAKHPVPRCRFTPPTRVDARFGRDFEELLKRFGQAKMKIIPSLVSFEFGGDLKSGSGPNGTGWGGRADVIRDPAKRTVFLDTLLAELLRVSAGYKDLIYAWEVINEPWWLCTPYGPLSAHNLAKRDEEVTQRAMRDFLKEALARIEAPEYRFTSTVGHRYFGDLSRFPTGTQPQFHYYAEYLPVPDFVSPSDPWQIKGNKLFEGRPKPILGEFDSDNNRHGDRWKSDLGDNDSTYERLKLLRDQGCDLALIWGDVGPGKSGRVSDATLALENDLITKYDVIKLQANSCAAVAKFTGGTAPTASDLKAVPEKVAGP